MNSQRLMSPSAMLSYNLSIVLRTIKKYGPISRADIARRLGCSKSTISAGITSLQELNLVRNVGSGNPKTGRKSILLAFNPGGHFVIAVDLRWKNVVTALVDMSGAVHYKSSYRRLNKNPERMIGRMVEEVESLIEKSGIPAESIEAVGIMVPGIVDTEKGRVRYSTPLEWDDEVDLLTPVRERLGKPVTVYNDANALALGEIWKGCGNQYSDLAFIYTEGGVGGACIHAGKIILGADAAAGEFGKMMVAGRRGTCRSEMILSLPALLARFGDSSAAGTAGMEYEETVRRAIALIGQGKLLDSNLRMIDEILDAMAQMVVGIIAVFNPQAVVVNCSYLPDPREFLNLLEHRVCDYLPKRPQRTVNLLESRLNGENEVLGAAAAAISRSRFYFVLQDGAAEAMQQNYLVRVA